MQWLSIRSLTLATLCLTAPVYAQHYGTLTPKYPGDDRGTFTNPYILKTPSGTYEVKSKYDDLTPGDGLGDAGSESNPFVTRSGEKVEVTPRFPEGDAGSYTNPYRLRTPLTEDEGE